MGKLLSIETGFTCNSRCRYCTQLDYRAIPQADKLDLSTEEIKERIRYAAENGYDQLGFSGGEPTIRPDFVDLIAYGRQYDFKRIGVTTNGRMFAYRRFAQQAMQAGLDGFTFSLHGHTPELHDTITTSKGALDQAMQGLRNIARMRERFGLEAHLMNNQILLPENTPHIKDVVAMLAPFGVRLFMIQPFIAQRSNVRDLGRFYVPYEDIVAAVEEALPVLERYGARIKPYNVPNCILWRFGPKYVEPQFYGLRSFREYERQNPGEFKGFRAKQWYRMAQCKGCQEYCPGFRIEQYPQERMRGELLAAAADFVADKPVERTMQRLAFSGTELFDPATLRQTLEGMAREHGPVRWMTAFCEKTQPADIADVVCDATEAGWLGELVLVGAPMDQRFLAQRVLEKGNIEALRAGLFRLGERRREGALVPPLRLLLNVGDLHRLLQDEAIAAEWPRLLEGLRRASGIRPEDGDKGVSAELLVAIPNFPRDKKPPEMARQRDRNLAMAQGFVEAAAKAGLGIKLLTLGEQRRGLDPARAAEMARAEAHFAEVMDVEDWSDALFRHPMSAPEMDFVSWSPPWLFERWDLSSGEIPAFLQELRDAQPDAADEGRVGLRTESVATLSAEPDATLAGR